MKEGLLCKETHEHVIRLAPPLIIRDKDINWALKRIKTVFKRLKVADQSDSSATAGTCPFFRTATFSGGRAKAA